MRIGIIGAGNIGQTIYHMLKQSGIDSIQITDKIDPKLKDFIKLNVENKKDLSKFLTNKDIIISAGPYYLNKSIAQECHDKKIAYFDLTEDVDTTNFIKQLSKTAKKPLMPQCGLAPGAINIIANHLAKDFKNLKSMELRVGALPLYPNNQMKYYLSWSTAGLINEYCNPCDVIWSGNKMQTLPLEGLEHITVDGVEYEAFNTSGGVGTLCDTYSGKLESLNYKTLRYPGHCDLMKFLIFDLNLRHRKELLTELFDNEVPYTTQDVVVIFVNVIGETNKGLLQKNYVKKIYGQNIDSKSFSAIQVATAAGLVSVVFNYINNPKITGFIKQEDISFEKFVQNPWGKIYQN